MDGVTLQKIKSILLDRRSQLDQGLERDREVGNALELAGVQAEIIDLAQALEQIERDKSLAEQERRELSAIDRALTKIATGRFGTCEDCEEEIPAKRLNVVPYARLCAKCQEFEERQQGRARGMPQVAAR
jgi:DnaK suppressor protein